MRSSLNSQETLLAALPIVLVLVILIGTILFFPQTQTDPRSRASEIKSTPPKPTIISNQKSPPPPKVTPQTACSSLYQPVCGQNNLTYPNYCQANLAQVSVSHQGECPAPKTASPAPASASDGPASASDGPVSFPNHSY